MSRNDARILISLTAIICITIIITALAEIGFWSAFWAYFSWMLLLVVSIRNIESKKGK